MSRTSGVTTRVTDALLHGAAARAGGELQSLDVSGRRAISRDALLAVATANAGALQQLRICHGVCSKLSAAHNSLPTLDVVEALLRAAPQLRAMDADVQCYSTADALRALRAEGLLAPLRVLGLRVYAADADEALTLASDMNVHAWLQRLCLTGAAWAPAALNVVVDAALTRRFTHLEFLYCGLSPASVPSLARLIGGGALTGLFVWERDTPLLDAPAAALIAGALRANCTLTSLRLHSVLLWNDAAALIVLLGALTAHPSLRTLSLYRNRVQQEASRAAAGAALGVLFAANAPALTELDVDSCMLGDAGMAPLFEALPRNTHLRTLKCGYNHMTEAFAADVLLPAVHANESLRALDTRVRYYWPGAREAEDIVNSRAATR